MLASAAKLTGDDKVGPARRVLEVNSLNIQTGGVLGVEENGTEVLVRLVQNLFTGKLVPPSLTVSVQHSVTVDLDVLASPLPEHDRVLLKVSRARESLWG